MPDSDGRTGDLKLSHTDAILLRDLLGLISMGADLRLYKWRQWVGREVSAELLAESLDELISQMSRYGIQLAELSGKLRGGA